MIFRRGILLGIIMIAGGISGILDKSGQYPFEVSKTLTMVFWAVSCMIGMIQIAASVNYLKTFKAKILLFCFALEGIYYVLAAGFLISMNINIGLKIFGEAIACVLLIVICTAIMNLWKKIAAQG